MATKEPKKAFKTFLTWAIKGAHNKTPSIGK